MAAVVSGGALGILQGSAALLGSAGQLGSAAHGRAGERVYVNAATGNLVIQGQDEILIGRGPDAAFVRTYNSQGVLDGDNNDNWRLNFYRRVALTGTPNAAGSTVTRTDADGADAVYTYDGTKYVTTEGSGAYDTLVYSGGTWTWTDGDTGLRETYNGAGQLTQVIDESNNTLTFTYDAGGLLTDVVTTTDTGTHSVHLVYYAGTNNLKEIQTLSGGTQVRTSYVYDGSNRLTQVTTDLTPETTADSNTYVTTYTYDGASKRVATMTQSDGTKLTFAYVDLGGGDYRVSQITERLTHPTEASRTTTFTYNTAARTTTVTDPLGRVTVLAYDTAKRLTGITLPAVGGTSQQLTYAYDSAGNVTSVTDAKGQAVVYGYNNGNRVYERDAAGNVVERVYGTKNELLAETQYKTADPDGAGAGQPAGALTTRYIYDSSTRLRFTVSAAGRVTEYRYNGFGERVDSIQYTGKSYDVSGLAPSAMLSEAALTSWLPADKSASIRSTTEYDFRGQVRAVKTFGAVDSAGEGIVATQALTQFVYDQAGNLLQTIDGRNLTTSYAYDGLARVKLTTDALGRSTSTDYQDGAGKTVITLANGLVRTSTYDDAGQLVSVAESAGGPTLGTTKYFYDAAGRLRRTEDPTGVKGWVFYDEAGRKVGEVDGAGSLIEYRYDANNNVTRTIRYANPVTATITDPSTLASIRPAAAAGDRSVWNAYDAADQLVKSVDAQGFVTQFFYDGAGRMTDSVRFATAISTAALGDTPAASAINPGSSSSSDRLTRNFHDAQGKLLATLDGEGYLVEYKYDAAGQLAETVGYATATDAALRVSGTLAQLRPAAAADDIHSYTLYNARGQAVGAVDGEGYLTETVYDAAGNKSQEIRYATRVTYSTGATVAGLRPSAPNAQDQSSTFTYDGLNRVASETNPEGTRTEYTYDEAGNLTKTVRAINTDEVRTLNKQYDKQGRLTAELSAVGSAQITAASTQQDIDQVWAQYAIRHTYDAAGRRKSTTDALGNRTLFYYDAESRLAYTINALGEVKQTVYDTLGQRALTVQYGARLSGATLAGLSGGLVDATLSAAIAAIAAPANDSRVSYIYSSRGDLTITVDQLGFSTSVTYNAFGEAVASSQQIGGGQTLDHAYAYDRRGLLQQTNWDPAGVNTVAITQYDAFGRATQTTDARGIQRSFAFDKLGRVVSARNVPLNTLRETSYDAFGRVLTQTDALGKVTSYAYNAANRSVTVTTPELISTTVVTDRLGQKISVSDGRGNTTSYRYDKDGNVERVDAPGAGFTLSKYDAADRLFETVDARGTRTTYSYDAAGRMLTRVVDPGGLALATRYVYDAKGQTISVFDANGVETRTQFDNKGQAVQVSVDPAGLNLRTQYAYDGRGKQLTVTQGVAPGATRVTQYTYDKLGRLTQQRVDPAGLNLTTSYTYDKNDNVVSRTDANGYVTRYAYDAENRPVFIVDPLGGVSKTEYDLNGRAITVTQYANAINPAALPAIPAVTDVVVNVDPARDRATRSVYDDDGREVYSIDTLGGVTQKVYDANGNLIRKVAFATAIPLATPANEDAVRTALGAGTAQDEVVRFAYDAANRIAYSIDASGAVVRTQYDFNSNAVGVRSYARTISATGDLSTAELDNVNVVAPAVNDRILRYAFDAANRQVFAIDGENFVKETRYDGIGRITQTIQHPFAVTVGATPSVAEVQAALAYSVPAGYANSSATQYAAPIQPYTYANAAKNDVATPSTQNVGVTEQNTQIYRNPTQPYTYAGSARSDVATPSTQNVGVTEQNTQIYRNPTQPYTYATSATSDVAAAATQTAAVSGQTATVSSGLIQPYTFVGSAKSDSATAATQNVTLTVDNTSTVQSSNVANYSWYRSGGSIAQTSGLSITPGYITYGDATPTGVRATVYLNGTQVAQTVTDVGYTSTESWSVPWYQYPVYYIPWYGVYSTEPYYGGESGYLHHYDWAYRTASGTRWNAVNNWGGQVNLGNLSPGTYTVTLEAWDSAQAGQAEGAFYDYTDGTWSYSNSISVNVGTVVKPTYVRWASSTQPAGTSTVSFKYRAAGSTGAYTQVSVGANGANHEVNLGAIAAGNYEYIIEYRDSYGRLLKSASGTLTTTAAQSTSTSATFNYTTYGSSAAAGTSVRFFTQASQWAPVDHLSATVKDLAGNVVSTALTYPEAESGYNGEVNLKVGGALAEGMYSVAVTIYNKSGTVISTAPFLYEVMGGSQPVLQTYAQIAGGGSDSVTTSTVSINVANATEFQGAPVANYSWYRSGGSIYQTTGLSIKPGYATFGDTTPTQVRATIYQGSTVVAQTYTDVGSTSAESWSVQYLYPTHFDEYGNPLPLTYDEYGNMLNWAWGTRTATGTRWNNVNNWNGEVNLTSGSLAPGHYRVVLETWDSAQNARVEGGLYDYTDGTWSYANTINDVVIGTIVQPTVLSWAASTQPAGTASVTFGYKAAGSGGAYTNATVTTSGANQQVSLSGLADGNYDYQIEYRNAAGQLLKYSRGTFSSTRGGASMVSGSFTALSSSSGVGSSIRYFSNASQWTPVDHVNATVKDAFGNVVSTAVTYPDAQANYYGEVTLQAGTPLPNGGYTVELTLYNKNGTTSTVAPFQYNIGSSTRLRHTLTWPTATQPAGTTASFKYRLQGSGGSFASAAITVAGADHQVILDWIPAGNYEYTIEYRDSYNRLIKGTSSTFGVAAGGSGSNNVSFSYTTYTVTASAGSSIAGYIPAAEVSTLERVEAVVKDAASNATVSTATTYPEMHSGYAGEVNLKVGSVLADGKYNVTVTKYRKDGTTSSTTFAYEIGQQADHLKHTVTWASATQPAGTTASFKYKAQGTGVWLSATVGASGANHQVVFDPIAANNYDYVIEYRDSYDRVLKSSSGTFTVAASGTANDTLVFAYTTYSSTASAGSSITGYVAANLASSIERFDAVVKDAASGATVSTAVTYPEFEPGYAGNVNLKLGSVLADGKYNVTVTRYNKDGTSSASTFYYEVGQQTDHLKHTVTWASSTQPAGTTVGFKYRPQGSTGAYTSATVGVSGANHQVVFDPIAAGNYEYLIEYRDSYNRVLKNASGAFTVAASGTANDTLTFGFTAYSSTAAAGSSISGYITTAEVPTLERVDAVVKDYATGATVSTAVTYPEFESGYAGNVNLKLGAPLGDGRYNVTVTKVRKDGTSSTSTLYYEVGQQPYAHRTTTVSWSASNQPVGTTVEFAYALVGQSGETLKTPTLADGTYTVTFLQDNDDGVITGLASGTYNYWVRYKQNGQVVKQAAGQFASQDSGGASGPLDFPAGHRVNTFVYDAAGRLVQSTDPLGSRESYYYDALGNKTGFTDKKGAFWTYWYDEAGRLTNEFSPAVAVTSSGGSVETNVSLRTHLEYDALGHLISRTEAYGRPEARTTQYTYDALGRQTQTKFPQVKVYSAALDNLQPAANNTIDRTTFEEARDLSSQVSYDTLGRATMKREADGTYSYKVHDAAGRVRYDIDAEKYVTEHRYDAFGNETATIRYANRLDAAGHAEGTAWLLADVKTRVDGQSDHTRDRRIDKVYDRRNSVVEVIQPQAYAYDAVYNAGAAAAGRTVKEYNAFGELSRSSELVGVDSAGNPATWADTYTYYDERGKRRAQVDAEGYVTEWQYDVAGNVTRQTEFAKRTPSRDAAGYQAPLAGDADSGYDRVTAYAYDLADRKISATRVGTHYSELAGTNRVVDRSGDVTTTFGYDAVGNLVRTTDAAGNATFTYYDALSRTIAVAEPARQTAEPNRGGATVTPLVTFGVDAFGKTVRQTRWENSALSATATGYTPGAASAGDLISTTLYDAHGRVIQTTDAENRSTYSSFDAAGRVAKSWQPVTQSWNGYVTPYTQYSVQNFKYDAVGNQLATIDSSTRWDYFDASNISAGGTAGTPLAGGVIAQTAAYWQTPNYDEYGNVVSYNDNFQPSNTVNLSWEQNLASLGTGQVYVQLGYTTVNAGPTERTFTLSGGTTTGASVSWSDGHWTTPYGITAINYIRVYKQNNAGAWVLVHDTNATPNRGYADAAYPAATNQGLAVGAALYGSAFYSQTVTYDEYGAHYTDHWQPSNSVHVDWGLNLASLGGQQVLVRLDYTRVSGGATTRDFVLDGGTTTGATVSWNDGHWTTGYGVSSVNRIYVFKKDTAGNWVLLHDTGVHGARSTLVGWASNAGVSLVYRASATDGWTTAGATNFGAMTLADMRGAGNVQFEMRNATAEAPAYAYERGTLAGGAMGGAAILNEQSAAYNAFGEISAKRANGLTNASFEYDNAGHVWRANQGDGVDRVWLYDVEGRATAQISSLSADLKTYADAKAADEATRAPGSAVRSETQYDKLGREVVREMAAVGVVDPMAVRPPAGSLSGVSVSISNQGGWGGEYGYYGSSYLQVGWSSLAGWGGGNVRIEADIVGAYYGAQHLSQWVGAGATTGGSLAVGDAIVSWSNVRVYKRDVNNNDVLVRSSAPNSRQLTFASPLDRQDDYAALRYKKTTETQWHDAVVSKLGAVSLVDITGYELATFDYQLAYKRADGSVYATGTGTFTVTTSGATVSAPITAQTVVPTVQQGFDRWGNVLSTLDPRLATEADATTQAARERWETSSRYDEQNHLLSQTSPQILVQDENGDIRSMRPVTRNFYDQFGNAIGMQDANAVDADRNGDIYYDSVNTAKYNAAGQRVQQRNADGGVVDYRYDIFGRETGRWDELSNPTARAYDKTGRLTRITRPDTTYEEYQYDELGNRTATRDGNGNWTSYSYDPRGNLLRTTLPGGQTTLAWFDQHGSKVREVNADKQAQSWTYDRYGRQTSASDLGGVTTAITYNNAGMVKRTTSSRATTDYTYDVNGALQRIDNDALSATDSSRWLQSTQYGYDLAGNRTHEEFTHRGTLYMRADTAFDALNRVVSVDDERYDLVYTYDANGNRRRASVNYFNSDGDWAQKEYWYKYDAMNRIVLSQGKWDIPSHSIILGNQGTALTYDYAGNRKTASGASTGGATELYRYDVNGRLYQVDRNDKISSWRSYDFAGNVKQINTYDANGVLTGYQLSNYDANGWLTQQENYKYIDYTDAGGNHYVFNHINSRVVFTGRNGAGQTVSYRVEVWNPHMSDFGYAGEYGWVPGVQFSAPYQYTNYYTNTYEIHGGASKEVRVDGTSSVFLPGNTQTRYDGNGNIFDVRDTNDASKNRSFVSDQAGRILEKTQGGKNEYYFYAGDKPLGAAGANGVADFDFNYTPVSDDYPSSTPSNYVVNAGDTLRSIAQAMFGDPALWYVIADANGLAPNEALKPGMSLTIPNRITNLHNTYETFKPYEPGKIIGDTSPKLPDPPPPPQKGGGGCGGIGLIILIVVIIVAAVLTAGAAAAAMGAVMAGGATASAATVGAAWTAGMAAMTGGMAAGSVAAGMAAAAIGGAIGSVVGQGLMIATGHQEKFSWKQVATSAVGSAVGAGMGSLFAPAAEAAQTAQAVETGANAVRVAAQAAATNAATQGVNVMLGLQDKFDWRGVAAAAAGAAAGSAFSSPMKEGFFNGVTNRLSTGIVSEVVSSVVSGDDDFNFEGVAGNAIAYSLGDEWSWDALTNEDQENGRNARTPPPDMPRPPAQQENWEPQQPAPVWKPNDYSLVPEGTKVRLPTMYGTPEPDVDFSGVDIAPGWEVGTPSRNDDTRRADVVQQKAQRAAVVRETRLADAAQAATAQALGKCTPETIGFGPMPATSYVRPTGEFRPIGDVEGFFTFNPAGKVLKGVGESTYGLIRTPLTLVEGTGNLLADAYGYTKQAIFGPERRSVLGGDDSYQPQSGLLRSIQEKGLAGTFGEFVTGTVKSLPGIAQVNALYKQDAYAFGASLPTSAAQLLGARALAGETSATTLSYRPSSGVVLQATEGRTTTILGSYKMDMQYVIAEMGDQPTVSFGGNPGGFNVLNVKGVDLPGRQFWTDYNSPWLGNAIARDDVFLMATKPAFNVLTRANPITQKMELTGFGREYLMMRKAGYVYENGRMW